jgi:hypothetical protein
MKSRDKLILLADGLDSKGLASAASIIDEIIVKRSFDEDTRTNLRGVIQSINQLVDELVEATKGQPLQNKTTGEWFVQGGLEPDKQDFFNERLDRIKQAVGYIGDLNAELEEDTPLPEGEGVQPEEDSGEGELADEDEGAEEEKPWWKFWEKSEDTTSEEGGEEGDSGGEGFVIGPDGKKYFTGAIPPQEAPYQEEATLEGPEGSGGEVTEELPTGTGVRDRGDSTDWWNRPENRGWTSRMYGGENNPDLRGKV